MRYICASIVATLMLAGTSFAATINVPADYTTIQEAIDAASDGDEILVAPGTYTGTGDQVVDMFGKAITLRATGTAEETIIDGQDARRVVQCHTDETSNTVIDGFTITRGMTKDSGAGISCYYSSPTIKNCVIAYNTTGDGGGIHCRQYCGPIITACVISNNFAGGNGGGIYCYNNCSPAISDCTFTFNVAAVGGGLSLSGNTSATLESCTIEQNSASENAGGIYLDSNLALMPSLLDVDICSNSPNQVYGPYTDLGGVAIAMVCPLPGACCTNGQCVIAEEQDCIDLFGQWLGDGTTCDDSPCPTSCLGDINGDGQVSTNDLLTVIANWGPCP